MGGLSFKWDFFSIRWNSLCVFIARMRSDVSLDRLAYLVFELRKHNVPIEGARFVLSGLSHSAPPLRIVDQPYEPVRQRFHVARLDDVALHAVLHHVRDSADRR